MRSASDPDIAAVGNVSAVPTIPRVISELTGMRLALVARVTADTWKACAVLDRMEFGLQAGGRLDVDSARAQLFQRFVKGTEQRPRQGLGLGLFIVSQIVKSHGGRLDVRSTRDEGTTFAVTIPMT